MQKPEQEKKTMKEWEESPREKGDGADALIKMMVAAESAKATKMAEAEHPKQMSKIKYTPTEQAIVDMLTESTGANVLDSGGAYGRHWESNRNIKDFNKLPEIDVETDPERKEIIIQRNIYGYLKRHLEVTKESKKFNKELQKELKKDDDRGELEIMEEFAKALNEKEEYQGSSDVTNTYNYDNTLDQVLQYTMFQKGGKDYIVLQIHNGADVRGGYTDPQVFELSEGWDSFLMRQTDVQASINEEGEQKGEKLPTSWYSDDSGYHWYGDGGKEDYDEESRLPKSWEIKKDGVYVRGQKVEFS